MARVESSEQRDAEPLLGSALWGAPTVVGYLVSLAMTAVATGVAVGVDRVVTIPNLSLLFVVPVVLAGVGFGLGPALLSAVLGALAFNFFLTEPRYSLAVDDPANIWAIALLFLIGLIVSGIAYIARRRAVDAAILRKQAAVLQGLGRDIVAADSTETIVSVTSDALAALFGVPAVVMLVADGKVPPVNRIGAIELTEADLEAARSSLAAGSGARAGVYPDIGSRFDFWPVIGASGPGAVIGLAFDPDQRPEAPGRVVDVVAAILALALDHRRSS